MYFIKNNLLKYKNIIYNKNATAKYIIIFINMDDIYMLFNSNN